MEKIHIGKINDFSNFTNANDGITLFKKNKITMVYYEFIKDGISIYFNITSTRNIVHNTKISIDEKNLLIDSFCSCTYKNKKIDNCKHIVASYLFFINEMKNNLKINYNYNFSHLDKINSFLKEIDQEEDTVYKLSYCININSSNDVKLELSIISNKTYQIMDISYFLNCILNSVPYKLNKNKNIIFREKNFTNRDNTFINELITIYSLSNNNTNFTNNLFNNQYIALNNRLLEIFLKTINNDTFNLKFQDTLFKNSIQINQDLDISPVISTNDNNEITLWLNLSDIISLFDNSNYFYFNGNIHIVSKNFLENYNCLKNLILTNNTSHFKITENNRNIFLNQILPKFSKHFNLKISNKLNELIKIEKCNTKFYIDKTVNDTIIIKVIFNYGNLDINPLETTLLNTSILRDYKTENNVLITLNNLCEYQNSLYYFIKSPEKIINFKTNGIYSLKNLGEIYYTKNFKKYKIISSSSYKTSFNVDKNNLLNISFSFDGITNDELHSAIKKIRQGEKYLKLKNKGILNLDNDYLKQIDLILNDLNIDENHLKENELNINKFYALYLNNSYSKNFESIGELNRNENFLKIIDSISNLKNVDLSPPKNLNANLRSYQFEGFKWLKTLKEYNLSGILADEMGLGKTIQTIAFLEKEYENNSLENSIIICPKSLIYNWFEEIKKFTPHLKVLILNGNKNVRLKLIEKFNEYDIILTSYGIIQKDIDILKNKNFNICIIDEAQNIKNKSSKNTISLNELKVNYKFALTGTPIENSIDELWSIFNFLMPGYLNTYSNFKLNYELSPDKNNLNKKISPFILRRLKKNVLTELPPKIETKIMVDLNEEQKKLYYSYIEKFRNDFEDEKNSNENNNLKFKMLSALTRLRQICCEPKIIMDNYTYGSSKINALMEILENNIKNNKKIIVFSNFTTVLNIIKDILIEKNITYAYLDGSIPSKERIKIVDDFNKNDYNIFLISLKAGGFGLNITSAEIVIHFDPWWNNAVENQATDRAHRIGQKNTIHVIKLITRGTIEEKIFEIQQKKNNLINSIIKDDELNSNSILKMSVNELKDLFFTDNI